MARKIILGETNLSDLHTFFRMDSDEPLNKHKARLFPIGNTEKETLTTSIFLASLAAVREYRETLLLELGINKIKTRNVDVHVYTELANSEGDKRPDGLIVITSGKTNPVIEWISFVESKIGNETINEKQITNYITFGREIGIQSIITISNEMVTTPLDSPLKLTNRNFDLYHWSWKYLLVSASKLVRDNAVADEDHIFILNELQRYMRAHKNIRSYTDMGGKDWREAVRKVVDYAPDQKIDKTTLEVLVNSVKQEEKDISLELTEKTGTLVLVDAKQDRSELIEKMLLEKKIVTSTYTINQNKELKFDIDIDFIRQSITCRTIRAIKTGKAQAQTTALLNTLNKNGVGATDHIQIKAIYKRNKAANDGVTIRQLLDEREHRDAYSVLDKSLGDEIKEFEICSKDQLHRDFQSPTNFVTKIENLALRFVQQVMTSFI